MPPPSPLSSPPPLLHTSSKTTSNSSPEQPWYKHLTVDLLLHSLRLTLLHPFIAWIGVLCLRAQATPYTHPSFLIASTYASCLTLLAIAGVISDRIAYGVPRTVDLDDEVVVITGGASGLGLLLARIYALRGVSVAVLDVRGEGEMRALWEKEGLLRVGDGGGSVEYYQCDVGRREVVEEVVGRVERDLGTPTVLVNCAAARINGQSILSLSTEAFEKTIQTNLLAAFHTCQLFIPRMLSTENGGTIVNVSSVLGQLSAAGLADYSASKAGLSAFHRTLEAELRTSGNENRIKTVLVEIGQVSTPLFQFVKTPNSFLAPVLEPNHVAQEIVATIDKGVSGVIRLPAYAALVNWYAVLPVGLQRIARYLAGIDAAVPQVSNKKDQ